MAASAAQIEISNHLSQNAQYATVARDQAAQSLTVLASDPGSVAVLQSWKTALDAHVGALVEAAQIAADVVSKG